MEMMCCLFFPSSQFCAQWYQTGGINLSRIYSTGIAKHNKLGLDFCFARLSSLIEGDVDKSKSG
jgi:hypothetical protein